MEAFGVLSPVRPWTMNNLDASTESVRQSSRAGNRLTETPTDRRGQPPGEDRGAAIREKALEILRRGLPSLAQSKVPSPESKGCEAEARESAGQAPPDSLPPI